MGGLESMSINRPFITFAPQVTPVYTDTSGSIDWFHYYTLWESLSPADRRVAQLVGVTEAFIARAIR